MLNFQNIENDISSATEPDRTSGCMFCDVEPALVIAETKNLYLIRDKFPITDGHLMVISKNHYGCMGELPPSHFLEIEKLREFATEFYQDQPYIAYEHGRAGHCVKLRGSQVTCHHFHLHFVPLKCELHELLIKTYTSKKIENLVDVRMFYQKFGEYLFFENSDRTGYYYPATHHVAPHLLRTLVCESTRLQNRSDWENL